MNGTLNVESPYSVLRSGPIEPGRSLQDLYESLALPVCVPVICIRNGEPVLRKDRGWELTIAEEGDRIVFAPLPQKDGLKMALGIAALIAAVTVAPWAAQTGFFLLGGTGLAGGIATTAVTLGLALGGQLLVNVLLPNKTDPGLQAAASSGASPTYSIGASNNQARLFQPIPKQYGRMKMVPDLAAQPYARFVGNEQYLHQLLCQGLGTYTVEQLRLGDIVAWDASAGGGTRRLSDLDIQFCAPGEKVTLFRTNVVTSSEVSGQEIRNFSIGGAVTFVSNEIRLNSPSTDFDFSGIRTGDYFTVTGNNAGEYLASEIVGGSSTIRIANGVFAFQDGETVSVTLENTVGPFAVCKAGRVVDQIEVDFVFPNGICFFNDDGSLASQTVSALVQARPIDNNGLPLGAFVTLGSHTYTDTTETARRFTETYAVAPARYEVRVIRTTPASLDHRSRTGMVWAGLKGYIPDDDTFSDVSLIAVRLRATDLTAQQTRSFNVIQTAKIPIYQDGAWSAPQPTRSIAWALADICRNQTYGAKLSDAEIDIPMLQTLERTWSVRGDTFDGVFDTARTIDDALSATADVGRASPQRVAGVMTFIRDEPRRLAKGSFTPRNIKRGSFQTQHVLYDPNPLDDVIVQFKNELQDWTDDELECALPGSASENPARVSLFGVTNPDQARRIGIYRAAANRYGRKLATFNVEMEGQLLLRGDPLLVSHDIARAYGQSGEVRSANGLILTLSEALDWSAAGAKYIALSKRDNSVWGPCLCIRGVGDAIAVLDPVDFDRVILQDGVIADFLLGADDNQAATRFHFGTGQTYGQRWRVAALRPTAVDDFQLSVVREDDRIYQADGAFDPGTPPSHSLDFSQRRDGAFLVLF